jgi:hypothetical protein
MANEFIDSSAGHTEVHTPSIYGATISLTVYKYGDGGGVFGSGQYVTYPDSTDWHLPDDFTISVWAYISSTYPYFYCSQVVPASDFMYISCGRTGAEIKISTGGTTRVNLYVSYTALSDGFHHFEFSVNKDVSGYIFIDGVKKTLSVNTYNGDCGDIEAVLKVGKYSSTTTVCYADVLKIDKGICRHTSNFTPPANEDVDNDEYTVLLLKMNANYGSTYNISANEDLVISDGLIKSAGILKADNVGIADAVSKLFNGSVMFSDSISLADSFGGKTIYVNLPPEFSPYYYWNPATSLWEVVTTPF